MRPAHSAGHRSRNQRGRVRQTRTDANLLSTSLNVAGRDISLTCHMAMLSGTRRRNSMDAIEECVDARASRIEVDVHTLAGDDSVIFHERRLEHETNGNGSIGHASPDD